MSEELRNKKQRIMEMVKSGKISTDEAMDLLDALDANDTINKEENFEKSSAEVTSSPNKSNQYKSLKVDITDGNSGSKVRVNLPLKLAKSGLKIGQSFIPNDAKKTMEENGISIEAIAEILENLDDLENGDIVNIEEGETGNHVRVYCE